MLATPTLAPNPVTLRSSKACFLPGNLYNQEELGEQLTLMAKFQASPQGLRFRMSPLPVAAAHSATLVRPLFSNSPLQRGGKKGRRWSVRV